MNSNEFLERLKELPPDTPLTASHVAAVFEAIAHKFDKEVKKPTDFDSLSSSQLINEEMLAEWIAEPVKTIQYWRAKGTGPEYVKSRSGSVRYKVGTIQKWIEDNTISNTAQGTARGILKLEGFTFSPPVPTMHYADLEIGFFESLLREDEPDGYSLTYNEYYERPQDNPAAWLRDCINVDSIRKIESIVETMVKEGVNFNEPAHLLKDGVVTEYTLADVMAQYEGDEFGYDDLLIALIEGGMNVSLAKNPQERFARSVNSYEMYKKLSATLSK